MMDFGFGDFLEKFEKYFGKPLTYALLALVSLAVASFCMNLIYTFSIKPLYDVVSTTLAGQKFDWRFYLNIGSVAGSILTTIFVALAIFANIASIRNQLATRQSIKSIQSSLQNMFEVSDLAIAQLNSIAKTTKSAKIRDQISATMKKIREKLETKA